MPRAARFAGGPCGWTEAPVAAEVLWMLMWN